MVICFVNYIRCGINYFIRNWLAIIYLNQKLVKVYKTVSSCYYCIGNDYLHRINNNFYRLTADIDTRTDCVVHYPVARICILLLTSTSRKCRPNENNSQLSTDKAQPAVLFYEEILKFQFPDTGKNRSRMIVMEGCKVAVAEVGRRAGGRVRLLLSSVDDVDEFEFQRRSTDEESVYVRLSSEFFAVFGRHRSSVKDSN